MTEPSVAQKRWRLLARALSHSPEPLLDGSELLAEDEGGVSVRRFASFELLQLESVRLEDEAPSSSWWLYSCLVNGELYEILVSHVTKCFGASELIGFNNTGNVCVWPSEECLAYYLIKRPEICRNRKVLELGGGMSCLAGLLAAKYCGPSSVTLTDGNVTSVDNVRCIVDKNGMAGLVRCAVVQWARAAKALRRSAAAALCHNGNRMMVQEAKNHRSTEDTYDVILCADCLFFDEARLDLVDTINGWLAEDGVALLMAPRRGATFRKFVEAAMQRGLEARQTERYDTVVWSRHLELLEANRDYCPDLHFPVLLELTKPKISPG